MTQLPNTMDSAEHIRRAAELADTAAEMMTVSASSTPADLIALGRLHAEIAHANATSDVAYYTQRHQAV